MGSDMSSRIRAFWKQVRPADSPEPVSDRIEPVVQEPPRRMKPKANKPAKSGAAYDNCGTPWQGIAPLLPYLPDHSFIWECAAGEGMMVAALEVAGKIVVSTDFSTGQDFLTYDMGADLYNIIVTNPPYSMKYEFIERCIELGKPWALLVPLETLGAQKAQKLLKPHGFEVMLLSRRVNFKMPNRGLSDETGWKSSAQFPVIWLCHGLLPAPIVFGDVPK